MSFGKDFVSRALFILYYTQNYLIFTFHLDDSKGFIGKTGYTIGSEYYGVSAVARIWWSLDDLDYYAQLGKGTKGYYFMKF